MINDKTVRTKDIRAFLEKEFPSESLQTVEEARAQAESHRKEIEGHVRSEQQAEAIAELKRNHAERRKEVEQAQTVLSQKQHQERVGLAANQKALLGARRAAFLMQSKQIRKERFERKPTGLAAFLGRVSGMELLKKQIQKFQDRKRVQRYQEDKGHIKAAQDNERKAQKRHHEMQTLDLQRKQRALEKIEKRELKSLEEALRREVRIKQRGGRDQMPSVAMDLQSAKARRQDKSREMQEQFERAASGREEEKEIDLTKDFTKAARKGQTEREEQGSSEGPKPASKSKIRRYRRKRKRDRDNDRGR